MRQYKWYALWFFEMIYYDDEILEKPLFLKARNSSSTTYWVNFLFLASTLMKIYVKDLLDSGINNKI